MKNKNEKIKNSNNPALKSTADDLDKSAAISALSDTEGGKILLEGLLKDVISSVEELTAKYRTLTMQDFVGICSDMQNKLDLARAIARSKKNKEFLEGELERMLAEEGE